MLLSSWSFQLSPKLAASHLSQCLSYYHLATENQLFASQMWQLLLSTTVFKTGKITRGDVSAQSLWSLKPKWKSMRNAIWSTNIFWIYYFHSWHAILKICNKICSFLKFWAVLKVVRSLNCVSKIVFIDLSMNLAQ